LADTSESRRKLAMRGLLIKEPWIDYILAGNKTWEIRGRKTNRRGRIALIRSGSGLIVGVCDLLGVRGPLSKEELLQNIDKHLIPRSVIESGLRYKKPHAWVLENARALDLPITYQHPPGAVIWVVLSDHPQIDRIAA
jgi:hypothetical protein